MDEQVTASGKQIGQAAVGKKKYAKQLTGMRNDTELLHLAAKQGDLESVKRILNNFQMLESSSGADFDGEVAKIQASMVNQVNKLGETPLYAAAENGHLEVVKELLKYSDKETLTRKSCLEFDPLHIAASQGHHAIVKLLLDHDESLCQTRSKGNATPLTTAASKGHTGVIQELLSKDPTMLYVPRSNGRNALHLAARSGHVDTVKILLEKDPQLARKMDKQGQTALHMAVKGASSEVVRLLLEADPAIVNLPDKSGLTALHVATRKKRAEIVNQLLSLRDTNVNALTKAHKTALDIAEGLSSSKKSADIRASLVGRGAVRANQLSQARDEFRNSVTQMKNDIHMIAKDVKQFHREGNSNNPAALAMLLAAMALTVLITVPGDEVAVQGTCFKMLFIIDTVALYTSLAVVVVHMTLGMRGEKRGESSSSSRVVERLMWLACVCTSVAFIVYAYIIVGRKNAWVAVSITVFGGVIMVVALGTMAYNVVVNYDKEADDGSKANRVS